MVKKSTTTKKRATTKRPTKQPAQMQSFRLSPSDTPFMTIRLTRQSLYWLVLGVVVIAFGVWIMKLQSDVQAIYDSIEADQNLVIDAPVKKQSR